MESKWLQDVGGGGGKAVVIYISNSHTSVGIQELNNCISQLNEKIFCQNFIQKVLFRVIFLDQGWSGSIATLRQGKGFTFVDHGIELIFCITQNVPKFPKEHERVLQINSVKSDGLVEALRAAAQGTVAAQKIVN